MGNYGIARTFIKYFSKAKRKQLPREARLALSACHDEPHKLDYPGFSEISKKKGNSGKARMSFASGLCLNTAFGPIVDMAAYAFAPASLLAPFGGVQGWRYHYIAE